MSFDPKGTQPGLTPTAPPQKKVALACRNQGCGGIEAIELHTQAQNADLGAPSQRLYTCTKCGHTHGLPVGGAFLY